MNKFIFSIIIMYCYAAQIFAQCASPANIYSFSYNNKSYEIIKELKSWADAAACAVERGGYLVEINDLNEQLAIFDQIVNGAGISPTYTSIANGGGIAYVWIGATDQLTEGQWMWDGKNSNNGTLFWTGQGANGANNGTAVGGAYYNWGGTSTGLPKEPDNFGSGQHHAAIGLTGWPSGTTMLGVAGEWNDIIGSSLLYFVVELESGTGINDNNKHKSWYCYPNPVSEYLSLKNPLSFYKTDFLIRDNTGKIVSQGTIEEQSIQIHVSTLPSGLYLLELNDNPKHYIKFIKE